MMMALSTRCLSGLAPQLTFWEDKDGQLALVLDVLCEPKQESGTYEHRAQSHCTA